jgi:hypothetical protein
VRPWTRTPFCSAGALLLTTTGALRHPPPVKMRTHSFHRAGPLCRQRLADPHNTVSASGEIGEANRVAVHRRIVVAGHGDRRDHVGGEHAAKRASNMHALDGAHRREERADQLARLGHRHRVRIVIVGARRIAQRLGCRGHRFRHRLVGARRWC